MFDSVWQDVKYALRSQAKRPVVTLAAVLSLALGIGVNTAIFSIFDQMMLRSLPVPDAGQIVRIASPGPKPGGTSTGNAGRREYVFSDPLFRDLERLDNTGLREIAAYRDFEASIAVNGSSERAQGVIVSGGYFPALGIRPAAGRLLGRNDDRGSGTGPAVVLAHGYWLRRFGSDAGAIGRTLVVNGQPLTIVGVGPEGFQGTALADSPDIFVPLSMRAQLQVGGDDRRSHWLYVLGRLDAGRTREQAQALMNGPFAALIRDVEFPVQRSGLETAAGEQFLKRRIAVEDGSRAALIGSRDETHLVFALALAVTGLVLLIACTNLANLMLARTADRMTEIAVRMSLGATGGRVARLLLVEACLLGVAGGIGGLLAARATLQAVALLVPRTSALIPVTLSATVVIFAGVIGLATGLLFGSVPALHAFRAAFGRFQDPRGQRVSGTRAATRFRTGLATAQVAMATALLGQATLFAFSLGNVGRAELGIEREGVVAFRLSPHLNGYDPQRTLALVERVETEAGGLPSVTSVTATTVPIIAGGSARNYVAVDGFRPGSDVDSRASFARVAPAYFRTLGIPLRAGREFSPTDVEGAPKVAIVNDAFVRLFQLGSQPLGRRIGLGRGDAVVHDIEIVGVVANAKYSHITEAVTPQLVLPLRQGVFGPVTFYVKSSLDSRALLAAVPAMMKRIDPALPVEDLRTMADQIEENAGPQRALAWFSSSFAVLAALLAGVGLYALLSYAVSQRLREIAIRVAVGATRADVYRLILGRAGRIAVVGGTIGVALTLALGRASTALLFGVQPHDPAAIAGAVAFVIVLTTIAAGAPARRAAAADPIQALRLD